MSLTTLMPQPTDYLGSLWALVGVRGARVICHGTAGCTFYDFVGYRELDPTRWFGPVFSTGLRETDVVNGGEDRLAEAVLEVDRRYSPELIALMNVTVAALMGSDPHAMVQDLQPQVKAKLIAFSGGGLRGPYTEGAAEALATLARECVDPVRRTPSGRPTVNLIGPTLDTFNWTSDALEIRRLLRLLGVQIRCVMSNQTSLEEFSQAGHAHLNLVLRDVGLPAAQVLAERCGTPFLYGLPFGTVGTQEWLLAVADRLGISGARRIVEGNSRQYQTRLDAISPWQQFHSRLRVAVAAPFDYALGLTRLITEEWRLQLPLVVLPVAPMVADAVAALKAAGASNVLVEPGELELVEAFREAAPHILFGSAEDSRLAPAVPVHLRAARPSFDTVAIHDGTPFVGNRGARWLAQSLVNGIYATGSAGLQI